MQASTHLSSTQSRQTTVKSEHIMNNENIAANSSRRAKRRTLEAIFSELGYPFSLIIAASLPRSVYAQPMPGKPSLNFLLFREKIISQLQLRRPVTPDLSPSTFPGSAKLLKFIGKECSHAWESYAPMNPDYQKPL